MLINIKRTGIQTQISLYAPSGDEVILTHNPNLSDKENIQNMTAKIYEIGPSKVSKHCADPSVINVFDVRSSTLSDVNIFIKDIDTLGYKCINEPYNGCVHVEIPQ